MSEHNQGHHLCPFCGSAASGEYEMLLHIEISHSEGESPFSVNDSTGSSSRVPLQDERFVECPVDGCGESILAAEMDEHLEWHFEEEAAEAPAAVVERPATARQAQVSRPSSTSSKAKRASAAQLAAQASPAGGDRKQATINAWKRLWGLSTRTASAKPRKEEQSPGPLSERKRLGKDALGKYAHEEAMPEWLVSLLRKEGEIKSDGIIPVLAQLLSQSPTTEFAYICNPCVLHISKLRREGGFCGYRNIQMMASYIIGSEYYGADKFQGGIPSVFKIQDLIEEAWDRGINARGRTETGGVRGTRKYIGTPEAQAVFCSLGIPCDVQGFKDPDAGKSQSLLLESTLLYFSGGIKKPHAKVMHTTLPPIYFQHQGHSLTIVGIEQREGKLNLLVFDPMFHDSTSITGLVGHRFNHRKPDEALMPYRRGHKYLRKYREFEVLRLPQALVNVSPRNKSAVPGEFTDPPRQD